MRITRHKTKMLLRGFPMYSNNGMMTTKHMVELGCDKIWRRVYERFEKSRRIPLIFIDGQPHDLTKDERRKIGYTQFTSREM